MLFNIYWDKNNNGNCENVSIKEVLHSIRTLSSSSYSDWELKFWDEYDDSDFLVQVVDLEVNESVYIPYVNSDLDFKTLIITRVE